MLLRLLGLLTAGTLAGPIAEVGPKPGPPPTKHFTGKVVPLASVLEKKGITLDKDAAPHSFVLLADDKECYVLIKDAGSRMFFKDKRLLDRPMRLTGRVVPGTRLLQVTDVHSIVKGKLHEVYYWCDECKLRYSEAGACTCCGAMTELIEEPLP